MERATLEAVNPVLPSRNVLLSIDFYVQKLGFTLLFRDSPDEPGYAGVARDRVELHLQCHDPQEWAAVERPSLRFIVPGVDALFEEYRTQGVFHENTKIRDTGWNTREFAFVDLDMNGLTFYRDIR